MVVGPSYGAPMRRFLQRAFFTGLLLAVGWSASRVALVTDSLVLAALIDVAILASVGTVLLKAWDNAEHEAPLLSGIFRRRRS